jgi:hypothetical protein
MVDGFPNTTELRTAGNIFGKAAHKFLYSKLRACKSLHLEKLH